MNVLDTIEFIQVDPIRESLTTIKIFSPKDISYIVFDASMGNYWLHDNTQVISIFAKKE